MENQPLIETPTQRPEKLRATSAKVFITSAYDDPGPVSAFLEYAKADKFQMHELIDNPVKADVIFFVENSRFRSDFFFKELKNHPLVKKYPEKVFMYNPHDLPWFVLRGLYTCMPRKRFDKNCMAASPYVEVTNNYIRCDFSKPPKFLYSFYGAPSSAPRRKIFALRHPPNAVVMDSPHNVFFNNDKPKSPQVRYAELLIDSKFVLAPKGIGTSSIRLFEIMKAGRVPVIISDNFVFPKGPDWNKCSIQIPENQVKNIPQILENAESNWSEQSALARKAWEHFFAPDAIFNYFIDVALELKKNKYEMSILLKYYHTLAFYKFVLRKFLIQQVKKLIAYLKKNNLVESYYI